MNKTSALFNFFHFKVQIPHKSEKCCVTSPTVSDRPLRTYTGSFSPLTCSAGYTICEINSFYCCPRTHSCVAAGNSVLCSDTAAGGGSNIPMTTVEAVSQGLGAPVGVGSPSGGT